ncbi:MAG: hypothetical protein ACTTI3_05685 [Treponema sp.]
MYALIRYEIKKMLTDTAAKYVFALLLGWTFFSVYTVITGSWCSAPYSDSEAVADLSTNRGYSGLKAIKETKRRYRQYTGETTLSVPLLRAAYRVREQLNEDFKKEAEAADWPPYLYNEYRERNALKYSDFYPNVVWFFLYLMTSESLGEAAEDFIPDSFYDEFFDSQAAAGVTRVESERHLLRQKYAELPVPFRFGYCAGWDQLAGKFRTFVYWLPALITLFFILILKYEQESGMDTITFTTVYGRTKGVYAKLIAGGCTVAILYTAVSLVYALSLLSVFGFEGGSYPIQITLWANFYAMSVYPLNLMQWCLVQYLMGLTVTVSAALCAYWVFSLMRNAFVSLAVVWALYYGVTLLNFVSHDYEAYIGALQNYIQRIGMNALDMLNIFCGQIQNGDFIYFFGIPILRAYGLVIVYAAVSIVLAGMSIYRYRRCEIR